ncbi:TonB-dependent receptor plug domain-containing protein [Proteobacteria bacterium 005FR1]|nr:TonB-dependent receptor plug domain-containing protein [Proteobacteria bacterium 005FR1]
MNIFNFRRKELALAVAATLATAGASTTYAQEGTSGTQAPKPEISGPAIEEIVVTTRLMDSAQELVLERMEQPFSAEVLGVDQIVRVGDSDVAAALRRVTGLTLIDGQYVYVRGLGERYSSTTLNGALVPSPELSRNVIPLDLFPTSILSSLKVHKAYAPDQPAAFGGGNIDIRTRGVPANPVFSVSVGTGWNSESGDDGLTTLGDGGDLPGPIAAAIRVPGAVEANNQDLMLSLNRDIEIEEDSLDPDFDASITAGNSWLLNDDVEVGVLATVEAKNQFRNEDQVERGFSNPDQIYANVNRTVEEDNLTAALNLELNFQNKHSLATSSYVLQNNEDQSSIVLSHNPDFLFADGQQRKLYATRLEERELIVNQVTGEHIIEDGDFGFVALPDFITAVNVNWIYSDSTARTDIPNATSIQATNTLDPATGRVISSSLSVGSSSQFNFLELEDDVESGGFEVELPFEFANVYGTISGGYQDNTKTRNYYGYTANIEAPGTSNREGTPGQVLSNENLLDPANGFFVTMGSNFGTESYIAAETLQAAFGAFDVTFDNTWRLSGGVRWEDFNRGVLPIDLLDLEGEYIRRLIEDLQNPNQRMAIHADDVYPAIALTYMDQGFMGADDFQVRLGYGKTVVRPDLREVSDVQFIDPELNIRRKGNPNLLFAEIDHLDLRAEWFYGDGSSMTASLFYKEIANPIEEVERPGPQDAKLLSYDNAKTGEIYGIEFEGLKELGSGFFLTGNLVLSDSKVEFSELSAQTSESRRLTGHSEYVVNAQLGYDSDDGRHSVSTVYNVFGERVFFAGLSPSPDAYEEPFHSLDMVYSFYPTDQATIKLKAQNILGEQREFTQGGVTILEEEVGTSLSLDFKWAF